LDDFEFTFVELPKFKKELTQLKSILDRWIYFIKHAQDLTMIPQEYHNIEAFQEAFEIAKQTSWNKEELKVYDYMALKEFDEINALKTAEEKGLQKGLEKGLEKGLQKGLQKGKLEEKLTIAKNLLRVGIEVSMIATTTGLSIEQIETLKDR
jgi:predicted transposase/invertase (TIGR01784 family)